MFIDTIFSWTKKRATSLVIVSAALAVVSLGGMVAAQPTFAQAVTAQQYGMIDTARVQREVKSAQQVTNDLQNYKKAMNAVLQRLDQGSARFLAVAEIAELGDLYQKDKPTDVEQKRIGALEAKGDGLKREFTSLQSVTAPTDVQTARAATLNDVVTQGNTALRNLQNTYNNQWNDKVEAADRKVQGLIRDSVTKISKVKNLAAVFTTDIAVYADVDITDEVIADMNK